MRSRIPEILKSILGDALYRGSLLLLLDSAAVSAFGFAFWTLAARSYSATAVGVFSGITSGVSLLAAIAALGVPNTITRHLSGAPDARRLVIVSVTAIAVVGGVLCLLTVIILGPHLPAALHLREHGGVALLVTGLVIITAVSTAVNAGLVAVRATQAVLLTTVAGSIIKIAALIVLTGLGSSGLLLAYGLGLLLATGLGGLALGRRLQGTARSGPIELLRRYASRTAGSYLAGVFGLLPATIVPLVVLIARGAAETAVFTVAFLVSSVLNFIPAVSAQVLFAEASRPGQRAVAQLAKALKWVYGLLLPAVVIVLAAAPLILRVFGPAYAAAGTGCLRFLALSTVFTAGTYLLEAVLIARDRMSAYVFGNGANAVLAIGFVVALVSRGITAAAFGWAVARGLSLLVVVLVVKLDRSGRHHKPLIRQRLTGRPMMPTTLLAGQIGWRQPIAGVRERVTKPRLDDTNEPRPPIEIHSLPGTVALSGLWFPPAEVRVGHGQVRSSAQLPVLTMISGYSAWMTALLIPSQQTGDLFLGWWQLLGELGAVPHELVWASGEAAVRQPSEETELTTEGRQFSESLGVTIVSASETVGDRKLIERAHADLEHSFLPRRTFASPADFNTQLRDWLRAANNQPRGPGNRPPADLLAVDTRGMLPLPPTPPAMGWHVTAQVGDRPFVDFDSNHYSVDPACRGRTVDVVADLAFVRARYDGRLVAYHERAWTNGQAIGTVAHLSDPGSPRPRSPHDGEG